jgi:hypothetical protein
MSFVRDGIENVRVFILPDGVRADGRCAIVSGAALVTWRSSQAGMFHQVYLNDRLAGATLDAQQRRLVVRAPTGLASAVRVTVIAVPAGEAHIDFGGELGHAVVPSGRVRLRFLRSQALPPGAVAAIYCDDGTGDIDYTRRVNVAPIPIWPCTQDKAGFGMAQFAAGDFGYDAAASVGFGRGAFGHDQFGLDAEPIDWVSPAYPLGLYRFAVRISDVRGNEGPATQTLPITVVPAAVPAAGLDITAFDSQTNRLTLLVRD